MRKFSVIVAFLLAALVAAPVGAISDAQKSAVSENCPSIQQSLRSLQRADSRTRVYLGSIYQIVLTNYITPLNLRLVKNDQPNAALSSSQANFAAARDESSRKFITYSQALEELTLIDCAAQPEDFYNKLTEVRKKRSELSESTAKVRKILSEHIDTVNKLKEKL